MNEDYRKQLEYRIKVEQACLDGKDIEHKAGWAKIWEETKTPNFDWRRYDYRIAPKKPMNIWVNVYQDKGEKLFSIVYNNPEEAIEAAGKNAIRVDVHYP